MFVKSMTWSMLPAVPWLMPAFTPRYRAGHGAGPGGVAGDGGAIGLPAAMLADAAGVAVTVTAWAGAADGLAEPPQAVSRTALQPSAAPAMARGARRRGVVIAGVLPPSRGPRSARTAQKAATGV